MAAKTISFPKGKGYLTHNNREFICNNVVPERTSWNRIYIQEPLNDAYEKCFGQALRDYNAAQKRKDRQKADYLKEIENSGNKEKTFYENIVQIGKKEDTPVVDENGNLTEDAKTAIEILEQYAKTFQERNPNLYLFNCVMHLDEATPHLHIDYIPVAHGYKKGMETRNSLTKAFQQMGFAKAVSRKQNETVAWQERERKYLTELCRELGEYRKGLRYVFLYQEKLLYLQNHPEKAMLQNAADVTFDSALSKEVSLYVEGLFFAAELEDLKKIRMLLSWIPWEEQERVLPWYPRLEEWKKTYGGMRDAILKEFIRLDTKNVYVCIQKMLFAECGSVDGKMAEKMTELWEICANHCPPGFQWELIEIAVRNQFALRPLLEHMTPETWTDYVLTVVSSKRTDLLENFYRNMEPLLEGFPFYARQMEQSVLEKLLTGGVVDSSRLSDLMRQYCTSLTADAKALYREEALENPAAFALPSRCQFAQNLEQAFLYIEQERFADSLPFLKKAVHIYPQMSPAVGQMIPYLEEQIRSPRQEITDEFRLLSTQVKQVLYDLVEKRQWEEAYGVADRLLSLLPDDLDVLRLKQVILRERRSTQNGLGGKMNGAVT